MAMTVTASMHRRHLKGACGVGVLLFGLSVLVLSVAGCHGSVKAQRKDSGLQNEVCGSDAGDGEFWPMQNGAATVLLSPRQFGFPGIVRIVVREDLLDAAIALSQKHPPKTLSNLPADEMEWVRSPNPTVRHFGYVSWVFRTVEMKNSSAAGPLVEILWTQDAGWRISHIYRRNPYQNYPTWKNSMFRFRVERPLGEKIVKSFICTSALSMPIYSYKASNEVLISWSNPSEFLQEPGPGMRTFSVEWAGRRLLAYGVNEAFLCVRGLGPIATGDLRGGRRVADVPVGMSAALVIMPKANAVVVQARSKCASVVRELPVTPLPGESEQMSGE